MGLLLNAISANTYMELPFYYHFVMGGFAFGAVFMATDPVSGSQTEKRKMDLWLSDRYPVDSDQGA